MENCKVQTVAKNTEKKRGKFFIKNVLLQMFLLCTL